MERLGISHLAANDQAALEYSKIENFQPTCMHFVKQCYPKILSNNQHQYKDLEEAIALRKGVRDQLSKIKLSEGEKAQVVKRLRQKMGLYDPEADNSIQQKSLEGDQKFIGL